MLIVFYFFWNQLKKNTFDKIHIYYFTRVLLKSYWPLFQSNQFDSLDAKVKHNILLFLLALP